MSYDIKKKEKLIKKNKLINYIYLFIKKYL